MTKVNDSWDSLRTRWDYVLNLLEVAGTSGPTLRNLQGNDSGHALVEVSAAALPTGAATQTTLAAILARVPALGQALAAASTPVVMTALQAALLGGSRNSTTPDLTTTDARNLELARDGSLRVNADLYDWKHQTHLVSSTAAQQVAFVRSTPTYPFDGVRVSTDGVVLFGQPRGRPYHVPDGLTFASPSSWTTAGTDWSIASSKATPAASAGGTDELVPVTMGDGPLIAGKTYLVYTKVVHRGGTGVTAYCGTQAGTQITATGEHVQALVNTGGNSAKLVASNDWNGDVLAYAIFPRTPILTAKVYEAFALTEVFGVAASTAMTTLLSASSCEVYGCYRRFPGIGDLG